MDLSIVEEILGDAFLVHCTSDNARAFSLAKELRPALVLLDMMPPGDDGLAICQRMRADRTLHDAVIIIVSAKAMPKERENGLLAGADAYITKPFDEDELLLTVQQHLPI